MKIKYFSKLAWSGIKNNSGLYIPYILSSAGIICIYYIMVFLSSSPVLNGMFGASTSAYMLKFGSNVLLIFSTIFLFYINSILVKRRLKEFGLYNVLGMNKRSLCSIWACESIISSGISILIGLFSGIVFSKLAELLFFKIIGTQSNFSLTFSVLAFFQTIICFLVLFFIVFSKSLFLIKRTNPLDLMKSESVGEKPPRANWVLAALGIILLAIAYFFAISIKKPITVLPMFFLAAAIVIIAIYLIFTTVSVALCKLLKNNKNYYYNPSHFISVSSMAYRMKRNGMGLASICVLSTMVMVMVTGSASLYFGQKSLLNRMYPQENIFTIEYNPLEKTQETLINSTREAFLERFKEHNTTPTGVIEYQYSIIVGDFNESSFAVDRNPEASQYDANARIAFIPLSDYNEILNTSVQLKENELLLYPQYSKYHYNNLSIEDKNFTISSQLDTFFDCMNFSKNGVSIPVFIIDDVAYASLMTDISKMVRNNACTSGYFRGYELSASVETQLSILREVSSKLYEEKSESLSIYFGNRTSSEKDYIDLFGGLLFFGILFSVVFIFATILIIYYKQLSEGFEDKARFEIMQKIGMTKKEIRNNINSQMITVFLLPVLLAALNLAVAIPMIYRLSNMVSFYNLPLIIAVACVTCAVFILIYTIVYKITSNIYFQLVSESFRK